MRASSKLGKSLVCTSVIFDNAKFVSSTERRESLKKGHHDSYLNVLQTTSEENLDLPCHVRTNYSNKTKIIEKPLHTSPAPHKNPFASNGFIAK